jgi:chitin synthase
MNWLSIQKLATVLAIVALDVGVLVLIWFYDKYLWYLFIISMGNLYKVIIMGMLIAFFVKNTLLGLLVRNKKETSQTSSDVVGVVIPCYTESKEFILRTVTSCVESLKSASRDYGLKPILIIVCDGKDKGAKSTAPTYQFVQEIVSSGDVSFVEYKSWKSMQVQAEMSAGTYNGVPYIVITKLHNMGKKDSLILVRELTKAVNTNSQQLTSIGQAFHNVIASVGYKKIDFLVGTDAGTRFVSNTVSELYKTASSDVSVIGVSGMVFADHEIAEAKWYNWLYLYQAMEYICLQAMTRLGQSYLGKVTCLPGCVQIFRMNDITLGNSLDKFKKLPNNSLLSNVRAYLGEDRRFTCLCLYENASVKTMLNTNAYAYTDVPLTWKVFLSQRRRWFLSANANNINDTITSKLPLFIRFIAFVQLWCTVFIITNVVCGARILWLIKETNSITLLIAFSVYIITIVFKTGISIRFSRSVGNFCYNLCSLIAYLVLSPIVNMIITFTGIWTADDYSWGLTQETQQTNTVDASSSLEIV